MWDAAALALFIALHLVDGTIVQVNPKSIISMRGRGQTQLITEGGHCMLNLADGKYVVVRETCKEVFELIEKFEEK